MENLNEVGDLYCLNKNDPLMAQVLDELTIWSLLSINNHLILAENRYFVQAENTYFVKTIKRTDLPRVDVSLNEHI